jgi:putative ABC transport system substrate-binding protein
MLALLAAASIGLAQALPKVDFVNGNGLPAMSAAFRGELARLGYKANLELRIVELRVGTDDLPRYLAELGTRDVDVVTVTALPLALAVMKARPDQKIVVVTSPAIVQNGLAASMSKPGGRVTGIDELPPGLTSKRLSFLHLAAPRAKKIALLSTTPGAGHEIQLADALAQAKKIGLSAKLYRATTADELTAALKAIGKDGMQAMLNFQGGLSLRFRKQIIDFADKHRIPAIYQATMFAEDGGLMTYAPDLIGQCRTSARLVARILKGESPGNIPITYPVEYLTLNLSAAKRIGLKLPKKLLSQAHRVIR